MKRVVFVLVLLVLASVSLLSCGYSNSSYYKPPSGLTTRVLASQSVASPTSAPGLLIINGSNDTLARGGISAGNSPGLMAISSDRTTLLSFDSVTHTVQVVNTKTESARGSVQLSGPTTSMVALATGSAYAAVPTAPMNNGASPGAVVAMNSASGGVYATISVPNAQTLVASPDSTHILVFSNDSDAITVISPLLINTGNQFSTTVTGFDRPVYGIFSADGSTAYILNCGPQCGSGTAAASVQTLDMATLTMTGTPVAVDGATIGWLNGSTLYVAGNSAANNLCTGQTTAAPTCGRLDIIDLGSMTAISSVVITDGYHDRMDMSSNGQLFIGSSGCTTIGNVNNPQGEVRGCLSIFDTTKPGNTAAIIPPDNGDVTGLQSFTSRYVEYVAEGGNLRVYDTTKDILLLDSTISTGTITLAGQIIDVKAIDFF
ncbi:MAG TPA: hypothetical protein VNX26_15820 [Candidatus Acidoferrum sp.]|nr:hypothetical protein [Candidatus Acidoferrum sp.]